LNLKTVTEEKKESKLSTILSARAMKAINDYVTLLPKSSDRLALKKDNKSKKSGDNKVRKNSI